MASPGKTPPVSLPLPSSHSSRQSSPRVTPSSGTHYGSIPSIPQIPSRASDANTPSSTAGVYGSPRTPARDFLRPGLSTTASHGSATTETGGGTTPSGGGLTEQQKADIVRRHLLSAEDQQRVAAEAALNADTTSTTGVESSAVSLSGAGDSEYPTPYHLEGGDVVAGVYKWAAQQSAEEGGTGAPALRRSKSLVSLQDAVGGSRRASNSGGPKPNTVSFTSIGNAALDDTGADSESEMGVREILEPGGFRRDFVIRKMVERGEDPVAAGVTVGGRSAGTRSFIDFLSLYGHFGGEDLEEIEEEDEDSEDTDEEVAIGGSRGVARSAGGSGGEHLTGENDTERTPLVRTRTGRERLSESRKRSGSVGQHGDATVTQAVLMLLKSFVGTGVLFLGKAFYNGGIVFSTIVLCFIAMISLYSFLLLVETRLVVHGSFGDIGGILFGKYMRWMILFSIVLSQIGFVAAYTIFVSQNLQAFVMAVTNCASYVPIQYLILAQLVIFLPLAMIRNIQKLSGTALIADAFILFGLVYIFSNEIKVLADNGIADVAYFNSKDFPLLIGTAVFSFEGIGLVIPITESMKDPHRFPKVLTGVMIGVMFLFAGGGALAYAAYGKDIQTVVFVNLPQEDRFVNAAQFLYSIAILLSTPLQLFPAVRIMENGIFSRSGKHSNKVKWEKNSFRMAVVVGCSGIAWAGAADLDKFVSLIGSLACVPLCFCYPAMLHYRACATTRKQKIADIALFVFGAVAALYTTSQTIILLLSGGESAPPTFGKCPPRS